MRVYLYARRRLENLRVQWYPENIPEEHEWQNDLERRASDAITANASFRVVHQYHESMQRKMPSSKQRSSA